MFPCPDQSVSVSHPRLGVDVGRAGGVGFDLAAQVADVDPQDVHFAFVSCSPNLPEQVVMSDDLARVLHQQAQDVVFGGGQGDFVAAHSHHAAGTSPFATRPLAGRVRRDCSPAFARRRASAP